MPEVYFKSCRYCGATGEEYEPALYGDGWMGRDCPFCNGWGEVIVISGKEYARASWHGMVYRNDKGQFVRIPEAA